MEKSTELPYFHSARLVAAVGIAPGAHMRSYEEKKITSPSRGFEV